MNSLAGPSVVAVAVVRPLSMSAISPRNSPSAHRADRLPAPVDPHPTLDDQDELLAERALPDQRVAVRHVDLVGELADLLERVLVAALEQRDVPQPLHLCVRARHVALQPCSAGSGRQRTACGPAR